MPATWPESLAGTPVVAVLEKAIARDRLAHSLLLHGDDLDTLVLVAHAIADRLLTGGSVGGAIHPDPFKDSRPKAAPTPKSSPPETHPDFFALRPSGKMRQIVIGKADNPEPGTMREFLRKLSVSPSVAERKVGVIYEADRMNVATSNAFLKTLEEPPGRTTLLLVTTRPYALLPTIRSRCLHFRFAAAAVPLGHPDLPGWKSDYRAWLGRLVEGITDKKAVAGHIMALYGLIVRFKAILAAATEEIWTAQREKLSPELDEDEQVAIETGIANGIRQKLFAEIEHATRDFGLTAAGAGDPESARATTRALTAAVGELERCTRLLRLNLNEAAALEQFLLASLRLWARR